MPLPSSATSSSSTKICCCGPASSPPFASSSASTSSSRETGHRGAVDAGVHGYLVLGCSLGELVHAVTTVARGGRYLCRAVAERVADSLTRVPLTDRELQVLQLVAAGESNKAIARRLRIELGTTPPGGMQATRSSPATRPP